MPVAGGHMAGLANASSVVDLQRIVGNQGIQRMLQKPNIAQLHGDVQIHRCGCGCGSCQSKPAPAAENEELVQRDWDEEEESDGGSWLSDATDWMSGGSSGGSDAGSGWSGGESSSETGGAWSGGQSEMSMDDSDGSSDSGGSWFDDTVKEVSDWFEEDETEASGEGESEDGSWLPDFEWPWDSEEEGSESESETETDETVTGEAGADLTAVQAVCETEDTIGHGCADNIKLHGLTSSNYNHAQPIPAPFPSGVTVTEREVKVSKTQTQKQFDASGTFDVEFKANPGITLPTPPDCLRPCQKTKVQAFIDGPLAAHEQAHADAFTSNYDGTFTATVNVARIVDTPENRAMAMTNPVNTEDQKRAKTANAASKKLDPWKETVPGLGCKDE